MTPPPSQRSEVCTVPPAGWWCSRPAGHDGPCAAREVKPDPKWMAQHHYARDLAEVERAMASRLRPIDPDAAAEHDEKAAEHARLSEKSWVWAHEDVGLTP